MFGLVYLILIKLKQRIAEPLRCGRIQRSLVNAFFLYPPGLFPCLSHRFLQ